MKLDALKQYVHLRDQLIQERTRLAARIKEIDAALGTKTLAAGGEVPLPFKRKQRRRRAKRIKSPISLKKAVLKVTAAQPLAKGEIFAAVQKLGWITTSKNPKKLLDVLLYGKNPKFNRKGGKFSPGK